MVTLAIVAAVFGIIGWFSWRVAVAVVNLVSPLPTQAEVEARALAEWRTRAYGPELSKTEREAMEQSFPWQD